MKKKILAFLTAGMLLASGTVVHANLYSERQQRIADALYHVDLFRGTNLGYELGRELTRVEGITLLVRMLGQEDAAMSKNYTLPFTDVADWAKPYVGYAYENGITNGISATEFGSNTTMTDYMFITLTLRALGYTDKGEIPQFFWDAPYVLANSVGLIGTPEADNFFTRGDAIEVFWNALSGNDYSMAYSLRDRGVFTADELEDAIDIYLYGKELLEDSALSVVKDEEPEEEDEEDDDFGDPDTSGKKDRDDDKNKDNDQDEDDKKENDRDNEEEDDKKDDSDKTENKPVDESETPPASEQETPSNPEPPAGNETEKDPSEPTGEVTYEKYLAMSGEEQEVYFNTFENPADFFAWLNDAKAVYDKQNPSIEIGADGMIDLGGLIGKENNGG